MECDNGFQNHKTPYGFVTTMYHYHPLSISALGSPDQEGNPGDDGGPAAAADLTPRPRGVDESIVTTCDLCVTISAAIKPRPTLPSIHSVIKTKSVDFN